MVDVFVLRRQGDAWETLVLQRAARVRCPGAWEAVHGSIERDERPADAALREVQEETGLAVDRLYNVTVHSFYLHASDTVMMAVVFAAVVRDGALSLGEEHVRGEWLSIEDAAARFAWPRARVNIRDIAHLLRDGDAGAVEDVLRVK